MTDILIPSDDYTIGDLVVDKPHVDLVLEQLDRVLKPTVTVERTAEDADLDLCLITLAGVPEFAASKGQVEEGAAITAVLDELRRAFADEYGGWQPEMEGNARVTGVVGFGHTKPMQGGELTSVGPPPWSTGLTGSDGAGVRVAVLDTGLYAHEVLDGHATAAPGSLLALEPGPLPAWKGHATFVAGVIAQAAPGCAIVVHEVLDDDGRATIWETAVALAKLAKDPAPYDIINLSLGCRVGAATGPLALRRAVSLHQGRSLLVAAAGNHGESAAPILPVWPAALPGVTAVGSTRPGPGPAMEHLSPITPLVPWVDCCAVGERVTSTYLDGKVGTLGTTTEFAKYASWSGTSFAAAAVSGAVAAAMRPGERAAAALERLLREPSGIEPFDRRTARHAKPDDEK